MSFSVNVSHYLWVVTNFQSPLIMATFSIVKDTKMDKEILYTKAVKLAQKNNKISAEDIQKNSK